MRGASGTWALIGRAAALALCLQLFDDDGPALMFVSGAAGVGKSALLREVVRHAESLGLTTAWVDGRDGDAASEQLAAATAAGTGLVALDSFEQATALGTGLRSAVARGSVRAIIASRQPPEAEWGELGATLRLDPLTAESAEELVVRRGLSDPRARARVVEWAAGSPLALAIATDAITAGQAIDLDHLSLDGTLARALLDRIAGDELAGADREVIAVASFARTVDARLLAGVLPGLDGDHAEAWLRSLSFAEPLGLRVTLHERVREAVRGALVAEDPEHARQLRRRLADHLHARAVLGESWLLPDLAALSDDEAVRWAMAPPPVKYRVEAAGEGDEHDLGTALGAAGTDWWARLGRWFDEPPHVLVTRAASGALAGVGAWVSSSSAPAWTRADPVVGPWLQDAQARVGSDPFMMLRDALFVVSGQARRDVMAVGNLAVILRSNSGNARHLYVGAVTNDVEALEFLAVNGYTHLPELDVVDGERTVQCHYVDLGPRGIMGVVRDAVYADLGLTPPSEGPGQTVAAETVRDALRCFHQPVALAANPLARGGTTEERAESMRRRLRAAIDAAFGASYEERLQRSVIERGYLDADGGHNVARHELHLGRTAYFRRLADASERVSEQILDHR